MGAQKKWVSCAPLEEEWLVGGLHLTSRAFFKGRLCGGNVLFFSFFFTSYVQREGAGGIYFFHSLLYNRALHCG